MSGFKLENFLYSERWSHDFSNSILKIQQDVNDGHFHQSLCSLSLLAVKCSESPWIEEKTEILQDIQILRACCLVGLHRYIDALAAFASMPAYVGDSDQLRLLMMQCVYEIQRKDPLANHLDVQIMCERLFKSLELSKCADQFNRIMLFLEERPEFKDMMKKYFKDVADPVRFAAREGNLDIVKLFAQYFPEETKNNAPQTLYYAVMNGHEPIVRFLLDGNFSSVEDVKGTIVHSHLLEMLEKNTTK